MPEGFGFGGASVGEVFNGGKVASGFGAGEAFPLGDAVSKALFTFRFGRSGVFWFVLPPKFPLTTVAGTSDLAFAFALAFGGRTLAEGVGIGRVPIPRSPSPVGEPAGSTGCAFGSTDNPD